MAVIEQQRETSYVASFNERFGEWIGRYGTVLVVLLLFAVFSTSAENFMTLQNLQNIMRQIAITAILAVGMTLVILIGGIDLSAGSVVLFSAAVIAPHCPGGRRRWWPG